MMMMAMMMMLIMMMMICCCEVIKSSWLCVLRNTNVMDSMLEKLEKYANNLEEIVQRRTADLVEEKKKTDLLLYQMLPPCVYPPDP